MLTLGLRLRDESQKNQGRGRVVEMVRRRGLRECSAVVACILALTLAGAAQGTPAHPESPLPQDFKKYPGLLNEFGQLQTKLQQEVKFPPERSQSRLLPLLPESTIFYAALPNYGDASHQALTTFQHELDESPVLRDWWQHGEIAASGPKFMEYLEKFYQFSQYLGDEIVVSGAVGDRKDPNVLILAEVQKPGLKEFLKQAVKEYSGKSSSPVRVLDPQELAAAKDSHAEEGLVILVRPDYVVGALNVATLRSFSEQLDKGSREFASSEFGQRVARAYESGAVMVGAANIERMLALVPNQEVPDWRTIRRTGLADAKYVIWEHKSAAGQPASQTEVSFTGKRRGVASWLAAPGPMGSLDFVSPKAVMAGAVLLKNPADIFDDISDLATASNPNALAAVAQMEEGLRISLKDDVLNRLGGEIAWEIDSFAPPGPAWKIILRVNDPNHLQTVLTKMLAGPRIGVDQSEEEGLIYNTLQVPTGARATEISYVFVDGYMVIASGRKLAAESVRLHRSGESLAKSQNFLAALPSGRWAEASGLFYEDPMAMMALAMRQASPEMVGLFSQVSTKSAPVVMSAYGEESAIRTASKSASMDAGGMMVIAAIAIPNLLRARMAANEASAAASIRTINTAQVTYAAMYPARGFARDLAALGPGPDGTKTFSPAHAGLIDSTLANASCTAGNWCTKSGYRFMLGTACKTQTCREYFVVATPVDSNTGSRNFCATSDTVVRFKVGPMLIAPVSAAQCRTWAPLQ